MALPMKPEPNKPRSTPNYYIRAGLAVLVMAALLSAANGDSNQGVPIVGAIVGAGMLIYGLIAKAVAAGIRASKD